MQINLSKCSSLDHNHGALIFAYVGKAFYTSCISQIMYWPANFKAWKAWCQQFASRFRVDLEVVILVHKDTKGMYVPLRTAVLATLEVLGIYIEK